MLPQRLQERIEAALAAQLGRTRRVHDEGSVRGGCISNATRLSCDSGEHYFLKWVRQASGLFAAEAEGLAALAATQTVRVPQVVALEDNGAGEPSWLLLEWLEPGAMSADAWQSLGRALAGLHRAQGAEFGWSKPNFIGSLPQRNQGHTEWPVFWRDERILPQLELAARSGALHARDRRRVEELLLHVDELARAGTEDGPSLLHGDLWGGNVHALASGAAALIDPSVYYGHREVDLAMATLFGGFATRFFDAYEEAWPLSAGSEERRLLYQLYYLLVHVNLFGGSYVLSAMSRVEKLGF